jgi:hypothetical protein
LESFFLPTNCREEFEKAAGGRRVSGTRCLFKLLLKYGEEVFTGRLEGLCRGEMAVRGRLF